MLTTITLATVAWISSGAAYAGCSLANPDNWNGGSGNWSSPPNWSGSTPVAGENVCITGSAANQSVVNLQNSGSSGSLQLDSYSRLNINGTLTMSGSQPLSLINGGQIYINNSGALSIKTNTVLSGQGNLYLAGGSIIGSGSVNFENQDNTIQGFGKIDSGSNLNFINDAQGIVDANSASNTLTISSQNITNGGLFEARDSGILSITGTAANAGGTIEAAGGTVNIGGTINGGTLLSTPAAGTTLQTVLGGSATLNGVTIGSSVYPLTNYQTVAGPSANTTTTLAGTITNMGLLTLSSGAHNALLDISGSVNLTGGGTVQLGTTGAGTSSIFCAAGPCSLTNTNNLIEGAGTIDSGASMTFLNSGTVDSNVSGGIFTISSGNVTNSGTFEADAGSTLLITRSYTNFSGGTLTGGTLNIGGTMQIDPLGTTGGEILTNASTIVLNGSTAKLIDGAGKNGLSAISSNQAAGNLTVENGATLAGGSSFSNAGTVTIGAGSSFTAANSYTQTGAGAITNVEGTLTSVTITNNAGATIDEGGVIVGNLMNYGTLMPGSLPSPTMTINGNYTQGSTGNLQIDIGGTQVGHYGQLNVSGNATLAGTLAVDLIFGFTFSSGESFAIIDPASISGDFSALTLDGVNCTSNGVDNWFCSNEGVDLVEEFVGGNGSPEDLYLQVQGVPEPSSMALLGSGVLAAAGMLGWRRRRRMNPG